MKWTGNAVDLVLGSNSQLRVIAEVTPPTTRRKKFVDDFVAVWAKVMGPDRYDLKAKTAAVYTQR